MIYRIASREDWQRAEATGQFASADLALEGFIHASELHQVLRTAARYYSEQTGLLLLEIDDTILGEKVKREDITGRGEKFPHVYGAIPLLAVVRWFEFVESAGGFALPECLERRARS